MLGTRGVPARDPPPGDLRDAGRGDRRAPARARCDRSAPRLEIMIPLVAYEQRARADARARRARRPTRRASPSASYSVGTMIELPRACFVADRIAEHADFFSFGTNDLTQTALGFSRDDVEGSFLPRYLERKILDRSPFETIDTPGVGLARAAGARGRGREAQPDLKLGICGEHGGDPESIAFFQMAGLDYVSCSPYRVPIARVAAAQASARSDVSRTLRGGSALRALRTAPWASNRSPPTDRIDRAWPQLARTSFTDRMEALEESLSPLATRSYPAQRERPSRTRPAHAVPARSRPDRALEGVPAPEAQDAGLRRAGGRPLPHAAHAHARGDGIARTVARALRPQRGPHRGDRARATTSATRRSGTSARTCSTRALRERFGRGFRHNEHSLRVVDVLEDGSTSPSRCATGSCATPGRSQPATLEGRIVRLVDRIAYINHDIDDALRAGVLRFEDLPARGDRDARRHRLRAHRHAGARPRRALRGGRRHRPGRGGRARRCCACASSCSSASTSAPAARASTRASSACCAALFDHYVEHPDELPAGDAERRARDRLPGRHDRPLRDPRVRPSLSVPQGVLSGAVHRGHDRARARRRRHGRARRAETELRRVGHALERALPVPRRAHALVLGRTRRRSSTTASAAARAATSSVRRRRPRGSTSARRSSRSPSATGVELEREAEDPRGRGAPPPPRAAAGAARAHDAASTRATCGSRPRRRRRASTWPSAGCRSDVLARVPRRATRPSAWDRVLMGARQSGFTSEELRGGRPRAAAAGAAACTTASAGGSCSRWPTRAAACSASARGRCGTTRARST